MVDGCGSRRPNEKRIEAEEADNERRRQPTNNEEGKEEEDECVEKPKSPPRQSREPAAENFFIQGCTVS
jgi:hypothetical protein